MSTGIYGDTVDGTATAHYGMSDFMSFAKSRPLLSTILVVEVVVGVILGLWALAQLHTWGVFVGLFLTGLCVPLLRFAVYSRDVKFRSGTGTCGPQCSCSPMCCGAGVLEGIVVFVATVLLLVKIMCAGGPWPCTAGDCLGGISTTTDFPRACTGNGYQIGCTRLVPAVEVTGPHRVACMSDCPSAVTEDCVRTIQGRGWCERPYVMKPLLLPSSTSVEDISRFVDDALAGMEHVSVDEKAASGECVVFRHLTVMSSFFGFLDDVWVCVKKGRCTNTTSGWEILAQGQLRMGKGDIGQNFRHIEELQDGVNVAAQSGRVRPMDC